jgi:hypothetical protein
MSILVHRLTRLIELHSATLATRLEKRIARCDRCASYNRLAPGELKELVGGIYGHLGEWLVTRTEEDIDLRYRGIGARRAEQHVPVTELLWCIVLVKENLWEFLKEQEALENVSQIFGELALMQLVEQFFDRAIYYAVCGHELRQTELAAKN